MFQIGGYGFYYYDASYILVIIGFLFSMFASFAVNSAMRKYHRYANTRGITGAQAAMNILHYYGIYDVQVVCLSGNSGDHYDPARKQVALSAQNYQYATVTALAVAAHECGHAKQHQEGYSPMKFRSALVPVVNIGNYLSFPIILVGVLLSYNQVLIEIGIILFALTLLFQLVTLPVEFNASARAIRTLQDTGMLGSGEVNGARKVLRAAAMTYVAATAASALQLIRLYSLFGRRRRR